MRWLFILLLLINLVYLGWEIDKQTVLTVVNTTKPLKVPATAKELKLLKEIRSETTIQTGDDAESQQYVNESGLSDTESATQQPYSDVSIEKDFAGELVTQMPNIIASDAVDIPLEEESFFCFSYGPFTEQKQVEELMKT